MMKDEEGDEEQQEEEEEEEEKEKEKEEEALLCFALGCVFHGTPCDSRVLTTTMV